MLELKNELEFQLETQGWMPEVILSPSINSSVRYHHIEEKSEFVQEALTAIRGKSKLTVGKLSAF